MDSAPTERRLRLPLGDRSPEAKLLYGADVREALRLLPDSSVQCVVTSPPYWGLRDYGTGRWEGGDPSCEHKVRINAATASSTLGGGKTTTGHQKEGFHTECPRCGARRIDSQIGLEPTPQDYVENLVEVFREVRRVLRDDGVVWLNLGDSYAKEGVSGLGLHTETSTTGRPNPYAEIHKEIPEGLKPKDMIGIPWRVAFALQADGWWLRCDVVWAKPNAMPESVTDRPAKAHEFVFLLTKSSHYFYDHVAVLEPFADDRQGRDGSARPSERDRGGRTDGFTKPNGIDPSANGGRNRRSVWEIPTKPYPGSHFAVMPPDLALTCIQAGTSEHGCCSACGAPWKRATVRDCEKCGAQVPSHTAGCPECGHVRDWKQGREMVPELLTTDWSTGGRGVPRLPGGFKNRTKAAGWVPSCECTEAEAVPCTVLDPFSGSATTGMVALRHGRAYVGLDLNAEYLPLAEARILGTAPPAKDAGVVPEGSVLDVFGGSDD